MMVIWQGVTNCLTIRFFRNIFAKNVQTIHVLSFRKLPWLLSTNRDRRGNVPECRECNCVGHIKIIKGIEIIEGIHNETI